MKGTEKAISNIIEKYSTEDYVLEKDNIIVSTSNCAWVNLTLLETFIKWATKEPLQSLYENINKIIEDIDNEIKNESTKKMFYKEEELIGKLYIENSFISIRTNGYIKLQDICKLSENKKIENWLKLKENMSYIQELKDPLLYYIDGIYAKPEVAFKVATWCNIDLFKYHKKFILSNYKERENKGIELEVKNINKEIQEDNILIIRDKKTGNLSQTTFRIEDNYINITKIFTFVGKYISNWKRTENVHKYLKNFIIENNQESLFVYKGTTFLHPKIIQLANEYCDVEILNFDKINKEYILLKNNKYIIGRKNDGYINLTKLCKSGNKDYYDWKGNKRTTNFLKVLSENVNIQVENLIKYEHGSNSDRATWGHPYVAINIAQWISAEFSVKVCEWVLEWYKYNDKNKYELLQELNNINPTHNNSIEKNIRNRMSKELGGQIEVETEYGFIDIMTDDEIIEIKEISNWKNAIGQILSYSLNDMCINKKKRIHLFSEKEIDNIQLNNINKITDKYDISLTYEVL